MPKSSLAEYYNILCACSNKICKYSRNPICLLNS